MNFNLSIAEAEALFGVLTGHGPQTGPAPVVSGTGPTPVLTGAGPIAGGVDNGGGGSSDGGADNSGGGDGGGGNTFAFHQPAPHDDNGVAHDMTHLGDAHSFIPLM